MVKVLPMDAEVVVALGDLPMNLDADPADRLIVATARAHGLALVTHDAALRKSRAVQLWKP
jgi:PIN domain nuclease of toxin-antitoxin system